MNVYHKAAQLVADAPELHTGAYWNGDKTCFCTMGAVLMAMGRGDIHDIDNDGYEIWENHTSSQWFLNVMMPIARRIRGDEDGSYSSPFSIIYQWNDSFKPRPKDEVVQLLNQVGDDMDGK